MSENHKLITGLSNDEVVASRKKWGFNSLEHQKKNHLLISIIEIVKEPMFLLLFVAASIYYITGDYGDGIFGVFG